MNYTVDANRFCFESATVFDAATNTEVACFSISPFERLAEIPLSSKTGYALVVLTQNRDLPTRTRRENEKLSGTVERQELIVPLGTLRNIRQTSSHGFHFHAELLTKRKGFFSWYESKPTRPVRVELLREIITDDCG